MNVSAPFIARPVATSLLAVAVLLCGILGYTRLPVSPLPQVDFPTIRVTTQLPGANPDTIASLVTASLERQFGQIPGLSTMSSQSSFGLSQITLQFDLDRDIDAGAQDVQAAINAAASTLPRNLPYPPVYSKVNPADTPVVTIALSSKNVSLRNLSDLANTLVSPRLSEITGVGHVSIEGGVKPAVRIQVDLARIAANKLSLEDVRTAVVAASVAGAKGALDGAQQSYTIDANDQLLAADSYRNIVIAYRNGAAILLRDIADIVDGLENSRVGGWYQGLPAVVLDVQRQPNANIVATVDLIKQELPRLQRAMPAGIELKLVQDRTLTIRASISEVQMTLVIAGALVVLVVLLFLRNGRATIIAAVTLPLSIIATFALMWWRGFSLDNLSLMALTIGTGFIVDDAIVMIENIVRNMEQGKTPLQAAYDGAREIGFTVISLTVSLIAVFIPLLFMTGLVGRMFREFALTLTLAVLVSAAISLTLTPMMCARLLKRRDPDAKGGHDPHAATGAIDRFYASTLGWALERESLMLLLTAGTLALTIVLYIWIPKGFLPLQDNSALDVVLEASPDASYARMVELQSTVAESFRADPDVVSVISVLGIGDLNATANTGHLSVLLRPREQRSAKAAAIAERLKQQAETRAGFTLYIKPVQDIQITTRPSRSQYQYTITGSDSAEIANWSDRLLEKFRADPILRNVASETQNGGQRIAINIDRERAGRLGISVQNIDDVLNDAFGQRQIATIYAQANQYRVVLEAAPQYQTDPAALAKLYVAGSAGGVQIPLGSFSSVESRSAPLSVAHQEQFPAATFSFDLANGSSLGDAVESIARAEQEIGLPSTITRIVQRGCGRVS